VQIVGAILNLKKYIRAMKTTLVLFIFFTISAFGQEKKDFKLTAKTVEHFAITIAERRSYFLEENRDSLYIVGQFLIKNGMKFSNIYANKLGKHFLGNYFTRTGKPTLARGYFLEVRNYYQLVKDLSNEVVIVNEIGNTYLAEGNPEAAVPYYMESIALGKENTDPVSYHLARVNLGQAYINIGDYSKAKVQLEKYLSAVTKINNFKSTSNGYAVLADMYFAQELEDQGLTALNKSIEFAQKSTSKITQAHAFNNLAIQLVQDESYESAFALFEKAEDCYQEMRNTLGIIEVYYNYGLLFQLSGKLDKAAYYYTQSYEFAKTSDNNLLASDALFALAMLKKEQKDFLSSTNYLEVLVDLKDEIKSDARKQDYNQQQFIFELEQLEEQNLNRKREASLLKMNSGNPYTISIILFLGIVFIFYLFKRKKSIHSTPKM
jgi:tetratricopeptide (TPR) repeat protein